MSECRRSCDRVKAEPVAGLDRFVGYVVMKAVTTQDLQKNPILTISKVKEMNTTDDKFSNAG
jgi:hypothetical protein